MMGITIPVFSALLAFDNRSISDVRRGGPMILTT